MTYEVRYQVGGYSGTRTVNANDADQAIAKVRAWASENCSLTPRYESFKVMRSW